MAQESKHTENKGKCTPSEASWSAWPEFTSPAQDRLDLLPEYREILHEIVDQYGESNLTEAFREICKILNGRKAVRTDDVPVIDYNDLPSLGPQKLDEMRDFGCFVIKNVVDKKEVERLFVELKDFVATNDEMIAGWPADNPCIRVLYWSKLQVILRGHPNHLRLQKWLNQLWKLNGHDEYAEPIMYADGVRIRPPQTKMSGLGPHIDAGSLSRWGDAKYREVYGKVFEGSPSKLDIYDITARKDAFSDLYPGRGHSSFFRAFQGWTALSPVGYKRGGIFIRPFPKETISYVLLRPFFKAVKNESDEGYLDPENWVLDIDGSFLPGTFPEESQFVSLRAHPHLDLKNTLLSMPDMSPGDTVWWHCDAIHAVDWDHEGEDYASVAYIPASPSTPKNVEYVRKQAEAFKAGTAPPDFRNNHQKVEEFTLKGYIPGESLLTTAASRKALLI